MYVSTATWRPASATHSSEHSVGPARQHEIASGTAATAVPAKPRDPSSVAQITSSPSASEHSS